MPSSIELVLPFVNDLDKAFSQKLEDKRQTVFFNKGEVITTQYDLGEDFYILLEGGIDFSIKVEQELEELIVGSSHRKFTPIGWSGFKEPYRYATTVTATANSELLSWSHEDLRELFEEFPASGMQFLEFVAQQSQSMLLEIRKVLAQLVPVSEQSFLDLTTTQSVEPGISLEPIDILRRSPFFEVFQENELEDFQEMGVKHQIDRGEKLFRQNQPAESFDMFMSGRVALVYALDEDNTQLDRRIVSQEGYLVSTGAFTPSGLNYLTCVSLSPSTIFRIDASILKAYFERKPETGLRFYLRLLWYYSNRLRSARAKLIRIKYDGEISSVKNLIEQNCTQLDVLSELHKVPHLLRSTFTLQDALLKLKDLSINGQSLERRLAFSALDILTEVVRENEFYNGLSKTYSAVVNAPKNLSEKDVRALCADSFIEVFEKTNYSLSGLENLPDEPAIFIYNHLQNHPFNTLPNNFQLTLDSHFISSVILHRKYGNPGVRVVRVPRGEEYGHQYYYERLGHIPVYTFESGSRFDSPEYRKKQRQSFYDQAASYLENNTPIMLAPEGTSSTTENSPGAFKAGAFLLAAKMKKEPLIVPVAVANFDKRLNRTTFSAVVKKPFRISEKVKDVNNREELTAFLIEYQKTFKTYIEEASEQAKSNPWSDLLNS